MITTILITVLPVIVCLLLGFLAAWHHDFNAKDAEVLNRMVLMYAVPLAIFVGTVSTPRARLLESIPLFVAIFVAIIGMYVLTYLLCRYGFRFSISGAALAAVTAAGPAVPFLGPAILGGVFGDASAVPISIASVVINLTIVPFTILLLTIESEPAVSRPGGESARPQGLSSGSVAVSISDRPRFSLGDKLLETCKKPLVWAPMLAFAIVLCGFQIPVVVRHSLGLLGQASGGVALFASGIVLAAYK